MPRHEHNLYMISKILEMYTKINRQIKIKILVYENSHYVLIFPSSGKIKKQMYGRHIKTSAPTVNNV